ncbi:PLAC8-domain-containing protein [Xylona heveae TC161]|uniref:PLAC8-domain-containing protein n=1 Tax=Xylona heveae (strain CBS 132557 / TC161) TaxID=1328760 RepID=A0A165K3J2_XYLHT|nr:PLAC8-domain-containing protein [Xylona heveae TC161]KZF26946.1 PLAC8-domain-containing protein [Xylona heveae TC161]
MGSHTRTYSWMETPIELQQPTFEHVDAQRRQEPSISQSSSSPETSNVAPSISPYPVEKGPGAGNFAYSIEPPLGPHPAEFAPYAEPSLPAQGLQSVDEPLAADRTPVDDLNAKRAPIIVPDAEHAPVFKSATSDAKLPPIITNFAPIYNPHSATGPNGLALETHLPGQIAHPNMQHSSHWKHQGCDCSDISVCCVGAFCPCIIYGKTQYRLSQKSARKDPTDLLGYSACNGACGLMALACGLQGLITFIQHTRIRRLYNIKGSTTGDCLCACCCIPCTLIQDEVEVRSREEGIRRWAGPASSAGGASAYVPPTKMTYPPARNP